MERFLFDFLKGALIGGTLTVPGVSGGTMAIILGIYERLIQAVSGAVKGEARRKNFLFLAVFSVGALLGIFALSGVVTNLLACFPMPMLCLFIGAVAGGVPALLREMKQSVFRWYHLFFLLCGAGLVILISMIPQGLFDVSSGGVLWKAVGGLLAAAALVLPGISVSHLLYVLGIYEGLMVSIAKFDLISIWPFAVGLLLGVLLTAKAVEYLLIRYRIPTYMTILGFVGGSVIEMMRGVRMNELTMSCPLMLILGYLMIFLIFKKSKAGA